MIKEVGLLYKNHTWNLVNPLATTPILREKWIYKLKFNIKGQISHYKAC